MTAVGRTLYLRRPLANGGHDDYCFGRVVDHMGIGTNDRTGPWKAYLCHDEREGVDATWTVVATPTSALARVTLYNTYLAGLGADDDQGAFARGEFRRVGENVDELIAEAASDRPRYWDRTRDYVPHLDGPAGFLRGLHGPWLGAKDAR